MKEVDYKTYCPTCKFYKEAPVVTETLENPNDISKYVDESTECEECLQTPGIEYSHKPVKYVKKET